VIILQITVIGGGTSAGSGRHAMRRLSLSIICLSLFFAGCTPTLPTTPAPTFSTAGVTTPAPTPTPISFPTPTPDPTFPPTYGNFFSGDINGDGQTEIIRAIRNNGKNIYFLDIISGGEILLEHDLSDYGAGMPEITVGDFTGDGIDDIFVALYSGGSGGDCFYWLITFVNNIYAEVPLDPVTANGDIGVTFDGKLVTVTNTMGESRELTISDSRQAFLDDWLERNAYLVPEYGEFYAHVRSTSWLNPVDFDGDGQQELEYSSYIEYDYKAYIAEVKMVYKLIDGVWTPMTNSLGLESVGE